MVDSNEMPKSSQEQTFQILSLDGGGIKGIFSAALLAAIEEDLQRPIVSYFDLVAGTSTGGIIAIGLGLGLTPVQILDFYLDDARRIFPSRLGILHWFRRKYSNTALADALRMRFGDKTFGSSNTRLIIPTYNLGEDDSYFFRTPHATHLRRDYRVPTWQVALATSAAPTYFPSMRGISNQRFIDGGVWANNPAVHAITEAYRFLGKNLDSIRLLSIGTTNPIAHRPPCLDTGGKLAWANAAIEIIMRGQSVSADKTAALLLRPGNLLRLNPHVPDGIFSLDGANRAAELVAKAAHHSRHAMPQIQQLFGSHTAAPYTPFHTA